MKIKLLTHTDLDGMGCALLLRDYYGKDNIDVSYIDYNNVNIELYKFLKENIVDLYDKVFITDISISENMANWVDKEFKHKVTLIDHHISEGTQHLNQYSWVIQQGKKDINDNELCSGTWLVKEYIRKESNQEVSNFMQQITTLIDRYDTWLWKNKYNDYQPSKELNDIYLLIGRDRLLEDIETQYNQKEYFDINPSFRLLLEIKEEKYQRLLENCNKYMQRLMYKDYTIGLVYANEYISELGNDLARMNEDVDFIALANLTTGYVSLRGVKDHVHLGNFAKELSELIGQKGGGHPLSANISLNLEFKNSIVLSIFKGGELLKTN